MASSSENSVRFIDSFRKHKMLVLDGEMFYRVGCGTASTYFKCTLRKKGCPASVPFKDFNSSDCTYSSFIVTNSEHKYHIPKPEKVIKHEAIVLAKAIVAENVLFKTSEIVDKVESKLVHDPEDAAALGKKSELKRIIRRAKRQITGETKIGTCREDFVLPGILKVTIRGQKFLVADLPGPNRTLIFATEQMLNMLADCLVLLLDGTFKMAPEWFPQIFTIHGIWMGTCIPLVYSMLAGKRTSDYEYMLTTSVSASKQCVSPEYIITDFELGIIKACKKVFPTARLSGCLFHLAQSIYRHVKAEKYGNLYKEDKDFRFAVRSLTALAFVPPGDVYVRFSEIRDMYPRNSPARKIISYFHENYIGDTWESVLFPIPFWNCHARFVENIPRTNNSVEGWHYKMNSKLHGYHPSVFHCIEMLKSEQNGWENDVSRISSGVGEETQTKKYALLDKKIHHIISGYNTLLTTKEFLYGIANCLFQYYD